MVGHMKFFVYIIQSLKDSGYYVGMSGDIAKRLAYHNQGRVRSTKHRTPFRLLHSEEFDSRQEARNREKYLKSYAGAREKLTIIENCRVV